MACLFAYASVLGIGCNVRNGQETLLIAGSSTMALYLEPVVQAFATKNPRASVVSEAGGAAAGVIALKREAIDVAMVARDLTADEDDDALRDYLVARDGVAIVVSKASPIAGLTVRQLADVASGSARSWKEVGGPDAPIAFVDRPKTTHLRKSFMDIVLGGDEPVHPTKVAETSEHVLEALNANALAISFVSFHRATAEMRAIPINGVEMSRATMLSGRYPLTRSFYLAVYKRPTKVAERFIDLALSKEGQKLLVEKGLIGVY
jgi:phosphate transport system substrate-binding protein